MKTTKEITELLSRCRHVDSHVHTHLCDGQADMTVLSIAAAAKEKSVDGIILTPHFHKAVHDETAAWYDDTDESIFLSLREEIDRYERDDGSVRFILSTETDILNLDGELSLHPSPETERALDMIAPTLNYHPCLPLIFVGLTTGKRIDGLHDSGMYGEAAAKLGGIGEVLSLAFETEINAVKKCPYPAMLGHLFMPYSFHPRRNNCFGATPEHLSGMKKEVRRLLSACREKNVIVDLTGVHVAEGQRAEEKIENNGFLVEFQKFAIRECENLGVTAYFGSDAHSLAGIGKSADYYRLLYGNP